MKKLLLVTAVLLAVNGLRAQDLPPLPGQDSSSAGASAPGLPPLPGQDSSSAGGAATTPPAPAPDASSSGSAPGLPPLPGQDNAVPSNPSTASPAQETSSPSAGTDTPPPESAPPPPARVIKKTTSNKGMKAKKDPKWRPNVIFGGWVRPKGNGAQVRIAWVSQEILNTLDLRGYEILGTEEVGNYLDNSWRNFKFKTPKSKLTLEIYLHQKGKKIWMRVGPPEAPAGVSLPKVQNLKDEDLKAFNILKSRFKGRITPRRGRHWESPFNRIKQTADV